MKKCSNRIGITLAVATITLFAGIQGLRAQNQVSTFADTWPELTALMADPDGLNSPNTGFAYELPVVPTQRNSDVIAERQGATK